MRTMKNEQRGSSSEGSTREVNNVLSSKKGKLRFVRRVRVCHECMWVISVELLFLLEVSKLFKGCTERSGCQSRTPLDMSAFSLCNQNNKFCEGFTTWPNTLMICSIPNKSGNVAVLTMKLSTNHCQALAG